MTSPFTAQAPVTRPPRRLEPATYVDGILNGDRVTLSRAISVVESELPYDIDLTAQILEGILPHTGRSVRVGISGVPGAGKSTFIDALGVHLVQNLGQKVAVLSIDPSSQISGGSILGDKTRMARLSTMDQAYIRPSPSRCHLGGVGKRTRETILVCEAAGFQNIIVETVGVGQSETAVKSMTDFFLMLQVAGAGDELQGIKRGIMEMVDGIAITKADGDNIHRANRARDDYQNALRLFPKGLDGWSPPVLTCSSLEAVGIREVWDMVLEHRNLLEANGYLQTRRRQQALDWMHDLIQFGLEDLFHRHPAVQKRLPGLTQDVRIGHISAFTAARNLLQIFTSSAPK